MDERRDRIAGFDSMRLVMVILVIKLHAAMTYMMFVPQWWYVIDGESSFAMALLVVFLDSFPMSTLFFLAGYFAPPSLSKRGASKFLRDKFMRIGLPWIIGVALVAPFFAYASYIKFDIGPVTASSFIKDWFFGPFYQQGHYWFLGLLFLFLTAYAALCKEPPSRGKANASAALPIAALWLVSVLSYYLAVYFIKPAEEWVNIGYVLYFQHARVVGYAGFFALGVYAWRRGWFTRDGWIPNPVSWGFGGVLSSILLLYWKFFAAPGISAGANAILDALLYNSVMILMTFFLTGLFIRTGGVHQHAVKILEPHSYSIYWLHQIVLMPFAYFIKPFDINIWIKWAACNLFTVFACFFLSAYFLKRAPLLRRIF
ncbi:MAG: acyltransferase family protein [Synergistaceae bacterium]|jgi:peptidoglycan/LPS O-acetylase OafA/YrhL|nr:acyltransferase family protein [Synergistaceae bacterium]